MHPVSPPTLPSSWPYLRCFSLDLVLHQAALLPASGIPYPPLRLSPSQTALVEDVYFVTDKTLAMDDEDVKANITNVNCDGTNIHAGMHLVM